MVCLPNFPGPLKTSTPLFDRVRQVLRRWRRGLKSQATSDNWPWALPQKTVAAPVCKQKSKEFAGCFLLTMKQEQQVTSQPRVNLAFAKSAERKPSQNFPNLESQTGRPDLPLGFTLFWAPCCWPPPLLFGPLFFSPPFLYFVPRPPTLVVFCGFSLKPFKKGTEPQENDKTNMVRIFGLIWS